MSYGIDLTSILLYDYRDMLKAKDLLPSRRMLLENIDGVFDLLADAGFLNVQALLKALGSPKKLESVSRQTDISAEYLTLLKREIGGLVAKIVPLVQFPELPPEVTASLNKAGIKNSKDVYEATESFKDIGKLCESGIPKEQSDEVCALCDFVRVNGVGALFAHILFAAGYRSLGGIVSDNAEHIRSSVNSVIKSKYSIESLGLKDAQYCIDYAALLMKRSV